MPHWVEVHLLPGQPSQLAFEVDVSTYVINRLSGDPAELWVMPVMEGSPAINLADPGFRPALAAPPPGPPTTPGGLSATPWHGADSEVTPRCRFVSVPRLPVAHALTVARARPQSQDLVAITRLAAAWPEHD